jgi:hypothetical protein
MIITPLRVFGLHPNTLKQTAQEGVISMVDFFPILAALSLSARTCAHDETAEIKKSAKLTYESEIEARESSGRFMRHGSRGPRKKEGVQAVK